MNGSGSYQSVGETAVKSASVFGFLLCAFSAAIVRCKSFNAFLTVVRLFLQIFLQSFPFLRFLFAKYSKITKCLLDTVHDQLKHTSISVP